MGSVRDICGAVILLSAGVLASIALAGAGDPQSVWLWRDVLGVQINVR